MINYNIILMNAAEIGNLDIVKSALENGADVNVSYDASLRCAAANGHKDVVQLLLANGADIHSHSNSALRLAAENGHAEVVRLLLDLGADIHADGDYLLRWAEIKDNEVLEVLKKHNDKHQEANKLQEAQQIKSHKEGGTIFCVTKNSIEKFVIKKINKLYFIGEKILVFNDKIYVQNKCDCSEATLSLEIENIHYVDSKKLEFSVLVENLNKHESSIGFYEDLSLAFDKFRELNIVDTVIKTLHTDTKTNNGENNENTK